MKDAKEIRQMREAFAGGESLTDIGIRFGVSRQRVHQLLPVVADSLIDEASAAQLRLAAHRLPATAKKRFLLSLVSA